jgi:tRNA(fMet)-specific endonuclease VapC
VEEEELVVCDTNILIEVIDRNNVEMIGALIDIGSTRLCISSISYSELIIGARNKTHLSKLVKELSRFPVLLLNPSIDLHHRKLLLQYSLSHGLSIQDALIAATAIDSGYKLFTLNKKDFKFIKGLRLI